MHAQQAHVVVSHTHAQDMSYIRTIVHTFNGDTLTLSFSQFPQMKHAVMPCRLFRSALRKAEDAPRRGIAGDVSTQYKAAVGGGDMFVVEENQLSPASNPQHQSRVRLPTIFGVVYFKKSLN